ncbi:hypothetical protein SNEBB_002553 [Seison nebaliae]|nr:hypothetical protein SNEBB_002553 [Seison nebaliae]
MDLASLKAEIFNKKKSLEKFKGCDIKTKKCFKRSKLIEDEKKRIEEEERKIEEQRELESEKKRLVTSKGFDIISHLQSTESLSEKMMPSRNEVIRRLREKKQPIRLFGETDFESFKRLRTLELTEQDGATNEGLNDMHHAIEEADNQYLREMGDLANQSSSDDEEDDQAAKKRKVEVNPLSPIANELESHANDSTTPSCLSSHESDDEKKQVKKRRKRRKKQLEQERCNEIIERNDDEVTFDQLREVFRKANRGNCDMDSRALQIFFRFILRKWDQTNRIRSTTLTQKQLRDEQLRYNQTVQYMDPLFKKLIRQTLSSDVTELLIRICRELLKREYIQANSIYVELAIGNAPWPIGATMVGIHARPGRERIASKRVPHALNDETQRKYIQAIKRLMSKCQELFPNIPSKCVDYGSSGNAHQHNWNSYAK